MDESRSKRFGKWDIRLRFHDHKYTATNIITGVDAVGPIISVTGFVESLFPKFDATSAVNSMAPLSKMAKYGNMEDSEIIRYWEENRNHAADLGTRMHSVIEDYYQHCMEGKLFDVKNIPTPIPSRYTVSKNFQEKLHDRQGVVIKPEHLSKLATLVSNRGLVPCAVEKCIFDDELSMAGTVDALFLDYETGEAHLYDWKRRPDFTISNSFSSGLPGCPTSDMPYCHAISALIQLNMYRKILMMGEGWNIVKMYIISIHPDVGVTDHEIPIDENFTKKLIEYRLCTKNFTKKD